MFRAHQTNKQKRRKRQQTNHFVALVGKAKPRWRALRRFSKANASVVTHAHTSTPATPSLINQSALSITTTLHAPCLLNPEFARPHWQPDANATYRYQEADSSIFSGCTYLMALVMSGRDYARPDRLSRHDELEAFLLTPEADAECRRVNSQGQTALMLAAAHARCDSTEQALALLLAHPSSGQVARMLDNDGWSALMFSVRYVSTTSTHSAFEAMMAHESSGEMSRQHATENWNLLMVAVHCDPDAKTVAFLLAHESGTEAMCAQETTYGRTALMIAAKWAGSAGAGGDTPSTAILSLLLQHPNGSKVARMRDNFGRTALSIAASVSGTTSTESAVAVLLADESGNDVARMRNNAGETPLWMAAANSRITSTEGTVAMLLAHPSGHDVVHMKISTGLTIQMLVASNTRARSTEATLAMLFAHPWSSTLAQSRDVDDETALMMSARVSRKHSTFASIAMMLSHKSGNAVVHLQDKDGDTALMMAVNVADTESDDATVGLLLNHPSGGVVARMKNKRGKNALIHATELACKLDSRSTSTLALMLTHESSLTTTLHADNDGFTALLVAAASAGCGSANDALALLLAFEREHELARESSRMCTNRGGCALVLAVIRTRKEESASDAVDMLLDHYRPRENDNGSCTQKVFDDMVSDALSNVASAVAQTNQRVIDSLCAHANETTLIQFCKSSPRYAGGCLHRQMCRMQERATMSSALRAGISLPGAITLSYL